MGSYEYSLGYYVGVYLIVPVTLFLAASIFFLKLSCYLPKRKIILKGKSICPYLLWIMLGTYGVVFGSMSILRYLSFHSTMYDLGLYDHSIWSLAYQGEFIKNVASGHFRPIKIIYALFYKLFPTSVTLLVCQTVAISFSALPLYYIARDKLKDEYYALLIVLIYFLYSPLQYNNLFDFHTDHLIILILLLAFYFLERKNSLAFVLVCLPGLLIKEPLILTVSMMGAYAVLAHRRYKSGSFVFVVGLFFFYLVTMIIIPQVSGGEYRAGSSRSFSYLGKGFLEIAENFLFHPWIIVKEALTIGKLGYLTFIFTPLMFIPLLGPLSLLPAIPALGISLLSRAPNYYAIQHHYTASLIPALFVSLIYGLRFVANRANRIKRRKNSTNVSPMDKALKILLGSVLVVSLYYNMVLSPSPISLNFWNKRYNSPYYKDAFRITQRDKILSRALQEFVSGKASVSCQNSVNNSYLAHRVGYYLFPSKIEKADYIILDTKRPQFIRTRVDEKRYRQTLEKLLKSKKVAFSYDGFYIFRSTR